MTYQDMRAIAYELVLWCISEIEAGREVTKETAGKEWDARYSRISREDGLKIADIMQRPNAFN